MIHYYRIENPKIEDVKTLVELVTLGKNLTDNGDGLYHENDIYYYKGKNVNNYLKYSGRLFRIALMLIIIFRFRPSSSPFSYAQPAHL